MITITKRFKFHTHLYSSLLIALVPFHDQLSQLITVKMVHNSLMKSRNEGSIFSMFVL